MDRSHKFFSDTQSEKTYFFDTEARAVGGEGKNRVGWSGWGGEWKRKLFGKFNFFHSKASNFCCQRTVSASKSCLLCVSMSSKREHRTSVITEASPFYQATKSTMHTELLKSRLQIRIFKTFSFLFGKASSSWRREKLLVQIISLRVWRIYLGNSVWLDCVYGFKEAVSADLFQLPPFEDAFFARMPPLCCFTLL